VFFTVMLRYLEKGPVFLIGRSSLGLSEPHFHFHIYVVMIMKPFSMNGIRQWTKPMEVPCSESRQYGGWSDIVQHTFVMASVLRLVCGFVLSCKGTSSIFFPGWTHYIWRLNLHIVVMYSSELMVCFSLISVKIIQVSRPLSLAIIWSPPT
jgi:hypothetical protein